MITITMRVTSCPRNVWNSNCLFVHRVPAVGRSSSSRRAALRIAT